MKIIRTFNFMKGCGGLSFAEKAFGRPPARFGQR
jgi:hypothetical protein